MNRRTLLGSLAGAGVAAVAGCLDVVGLAEHESRPFGVERDTREHTGYVQTDVEEQVVEESVDLAVYSETIRVRNWVTTHEKGVDVADLVDASAAMFAVLSTPQISIAGRQVNPVEDMSTGELVELVAENYEDIDDVEHQGDETVTVLGESTTSSTFQANAVFLGTDLPVNMHVTEAVATEEDLVVSIAVYPQTLAAVEAANVDSLVAGISGDVDFDDRDVGLGL